MVRFFGWLVLLSLPLCAGDREDVQAAERDWGATVVARDLAKLEKIYTAELIYAHSNGKVETKAQYMNRLKEGKQRYDAVTHESLQVAVYGNAAVTHSIARMTGKNDSGPFNDHLMVIHMWVKQGGAWRLAAHQTTKIP